MTPFWSKSETLLKVRGERSSRDTFTKWKLLRSKSNHCFATCGTTHTRCLLEHLSHHLWETVTPTRACTKHYTVQPHPLTTPFRNLSSPSTDTRGSMRRARPEQSSSPAALGARSRVNRSRRWITCRFSTWPGASCVCTTSFSTASSTATSLRTSPTEGAVTAVLLVLVGGR